MLDGSEIEFELEGPWVATGREEGLSHIALAFIDPSLGGTGYLEHAAEDFHLVARRALEHLNHPNCETACYRCLKSYANQRFHDDLRWPLANLYDVTIWKGDKKNKGWAGHVIERYLGLPINSVQSPNFGSWELKIVPLKKLANGKITVKETMAITMIDPYNVAQTPFEQSHLLSKLKKAIVCARLFESQEEERSILIRIATFDLDDKEIYEQVKKDYEETRICILTKGFDCLKGAMGRLIQPRTKGPGHGSKSRAFYARTHFVTKLLGM